MMAKDNDPKRIPDDASAPLAGSVYYRQRPPPRKRYTPSQSPSKGPSRSGPPRRTSNLGHAIMLSNIRTFSIMAVFMFALLGFAVYITGRMWRAHQERVEVDAPATTRPPAPSPGPARPELRDVGVLMDVPQQPAAQVRSELDTDAMRRAVFMQKRAEALVASGNYAEAIARFQDALEIWPYLTQVWTQLGRVYLHTRDYRRAQIALERAVESDPGNAELLNDLGVALLFQNRIDQAMDVFDTVTDLVPSFAPAHFNRALTFLAQDDVPQAERSLDAFLRLKPNDPQALKEKAFLVAQRGEYREALDLLRHAITYAPDWAPLYVDAAAAAALLGRVDEAIRHLDQAEAFTSPDLIYRVYQQPAFRDIRRSEPGRLFEQNLAERARELMDLQGGTEQPVSLTLPMTSP